MSIQKTRYGKCLEPKMECGNDAIRAHSVQNATALKLIEESNHVYEIGMKVVAGKPEPSLDLIGRKKASTFLGLCANHDASIFKAIDTKPLSPDDIEQLFLVAYRSVTRELHTVLEGAMRVQLGYQMLVSKGKVSADKPSAPGMEAMQHMMKAWSVWKYRYKFFDPIFESKKYSQIKHSVFKFEGEQPCLAASSFFSVDLKPWGKPFAALILNIIPSGPTETTVIFSYAGAHSGRARKYTAPVMTQKGEGRKYELSYMLINRAENFFLSPRIVDAWSGKKKETVVNACIQSVFGSQPKRVSDLMLF